MQSDSGKRWFTAILEHVNVNVRDLDLWMLPDQFVTDPDTQHEFADDDYFVTNERLYDILNQNIAVSMGVIEKFLHDD